MLDVLWGLFVLLVVLDAVAWVLALTVAGIVSLVKRFFHDLTSYR